MKLTQHFQMIYLNAPFFNPGSKTRNKISRTYFDPGLYCKYRIKFFEIFIFLYVKNRLRM